MTRFYASSCSNIYRTPSSLNVLQVYIYIYRVWVLARVNELKLSKHNLFNLTSLTLFYTINLIH